MEPIEHKLIPYPLQEEQWLIVNSSEIKKHDWVYNPSCNYLYKANFSLQENCNVGGHFPIKKVISSTILIDKSIPLIRREQIDALIEEDIYLLAKEHSELTLPYEDFNGKTIGVDDEHTGQALRGAYVEGFETGYNKHAETHPFTEEVLIGLLNYLFDNNIQPFPINRSELKLWLQGGMSISRDAKYFVNEYLQSLQQPKKEWEIEIECEFGEHCYTKGTHICKPKVDKEGYINILSIK
jgi:hypothetical protein